MKNRPTSPHGMLSDHGKVSRGDVLCAQLLIIAVAQHLSPESELPPAPPPARAFLATGPEQAC